MPIKLPAGYGLPGRSPLRAPWGAENEDVYVEDADGARSSRRLLDFSEPAEPPTPLWGSLLKSGYMVVRGVEIEGIPYLLGERELYTIRGQQAPARSDEFSMFHGLVIERNARSSADCNREKGLAAGRTVDLILGRQQLADEGLGATLFARPSLRATLTAPVTNPASQVFEVDSTTGWAESGGFYIGREYCTYSGKSSTSFGPVNRGVAGYVHYHTAATTGAYRECTDTPIFWRGRLVTVWEHLCSPEGRFLGERWCQQGAYCRQGWRGFVRDSPRPAAGGMVLTCLPIERLAAMEVGAELSGKMIPNWIVMEPQDTLTLTSSTTGQIIGPDSPITQNDGIVSLATWCAIAENNMTGYYGVDTYLAFDIKASEDDPHIIVKVAYAAEDLLMMPNAWFLASGDWPGVESDGGLETVWRIPLAWRTGSGPRRNAWIVVRIDPQPDAQDATLGQTGMLLLDINGHQEVVAYDALRETNDGDKVAFRLASPVISYGPGDPENNPWTHDTTVRVISGATGPWWTVFRQIMTSSGTGERGAFDRLPYGFGLSLPDDWIEVGSGGQVTAQEVSALSTGRVSVEDALCGWLAARRLCLVQRRQPAGDVRLALVSTDVVDKGGDVVEIGASSVLLDGHSSVEVLEAPNHIRFESEFFGEDRPTFIVRDAARAQNEGVRSLTIKAPGIYANQARELGLELIVMSDGQYAVTMTLAPDVDVQIGDAAEVTTAHPAIFDWSTGSYAPASILARVVGLEHNWSNETRKVTLLCAGQAQERTLLCPVAVVEQKVSVTVYRVRKGDGAKFAVGYEVYVYRVGDDNNGGDGTITAIDEGETYDVITIDSDPGISESEELEITFADYNDCTTAQQRFMFVRSDKWWR